MPVGFIPAGKPITTKLAIRKDAYMGSFSRFNNFQREAVSSMPAVILRESVSANGTPGTITATDGGSGHTSGTAEADAGGPRRH